jgi:hypothetical protein
MVDVYEAGWHNEAQRDHHLAEGPWQPLIVEKTGHLSLGRVTLSADGSSIRIEADERAKRQSG